MSGELDLEAMTSLVRDKIALSDIAFEGSNKARFVAFGYSDAKDILAALERAEKDREYLREKNDLIKAYAGPTAMTPEDVAAELGRIPELERDERTARDETAGLADYLKHVEAILDCDRDRANAAERRAERVEAAARKCWNLMERSEGRVAEELYDILEPLFGPGSALAAAPGEPSATFTGDYADAAAGYEALADAPARHRKERPVTAKDTELSARHAATTDPRSIRSAELIAERLREKGIDTSVRRAAAPAENLLCECGHERGLHIGLLGNKRLQCGVCRCDEFALLIPEPAEENKK